MRIDRKIQYDDYEPEPDICHDRVRITNKKNPKKTFTGWIRRIDKQSFQFETVVMKWDYVGKVFYYDEWSIEYIN